MYIYIYNIHMYYIDGYNIGTKLSIQDHNDYSFFFQMIIMYEDVPRIGTYPKQLTSELWWPWGVYVKVVAFFFWDKRGVSHL